MNDKDRTNMSMVFGTYLLNAAYVVSAITSVTLGSAWALNLFLALATITAIFGCFVLFAVESIVDEKVRRARSGKVVWAQSASLSMIIDVVAIICAGILGWNILAALLLVTASVELYIREKVVEGVEAAKEADRQSKYTL